MQYPTAIGLVFICLIIGCEKNANVPNPGKENDITTPGSNPSKTTPDQGGSPADEKPAALTGEEVVGRFLDAMKESDVDAIMKRAHVPFLTGGTILSNEIEMRSHFQRMLEQEESLASIRYKVQDMMVFQRNKSNGQVGDFLSQYMKDGDPIVIVEFQLSNGKTDRHAYFVKAGESPKIVGERDLR